MTTLVKTELNQPIDSTEDLVAYLASGARPRHQWGIGAESEKQVLLAESGEAAPFERVRQLLEIMEAGGGWEGIFDDGALIGLKGVDSSVTPEPGGQLELSGRICPGIHCCQQELRLHTQEVLHAAQELGLVFLGLGVTPFTPLDRIELLPKERYGVMYPYMGRSGTMGQRMMKQTAGLQVNLDFSDEADCLRKMRTVQYLAPLLYALFANSPIMDGKPTGFLSTRGEIWARTDRDRTGLIDALFAEDAGFHTYVDYALDVPMYFIYRDGQLIDLTRQRLPFRQFLHQGHDGHRARLTDWDLHLSTLFPEVRLRPQIEIRSADSLPAEMTVAVATLVKGILYDDAAMDAVRDLLWIPDPAERDRVYRDSWRLGLKTLLADGTLREAAQEVLHLARTGLERQQRRTFGRDERPYLDQVQQIADSGITLAERILADWQPENQAANFDLLKNHCLFI